MNNKGSTLTNWIFSVTLILLFVVILQTIVLDPMNEIYTKDFSTGLNTSSLNDIQSLKSSSDSELAGAEVTQTNDGLSLKSAWTIGKGVYNTLTSFISGTFINTLIVDILGLPEIVANTLVVLIWISLILIIIGIFMKWWV